MFKRFVLLGAIAGAAIAVSAAILFSAVPGERIGAESPSQRECEAADGTFSKDQGQVSCVISTTEHMGNSDNSQTTTTTTDTTGQGNIDNKQQSTSTCDGPGSSGDSSAHCK